MKTQALSEHELLRLLNAVPMEVVESVFGESITEFDGAVKAAHGGEVVIRYRDDSRE